MTRGGLTYETLDQLTFGVAKVGIDHKIVAYNRLFFEWFASNVSLPVANAESSLIGLDFYQVIGKPYFFDGDYAPLFFALQEKRTTRTVVGKLEQPQQKNDPRYDFEPQFSSCKVFYTLQTTPIFSDGQVEFLVELRDVSESSCLERRLETLKSAGMELTEVMDKSLNLSEEARKHRLNDLIERHMRDTLQYDVFEIRILEPGPKKRLIPFLNVGFNPEEAFRELSAASNGSGITGYVADSGESYICDDVNNDGHYLQGAIDSKSSLTVPLIFGNKLVGVCNVESVKPHAFSRRDKTFLELYAKDLAMAIHLHLSISTKIREMRVESGKLIATSLNHSVSNILTRALGNLTDVDSNASDEAKNQAIAFVAEARELQTKHFELKQSFLTASTETQEDTLIPAPNIYPDSWADAIDKCPDAVKYLSGRHVLVVDKEPQIYVEQLEELSARVDVVHSTKSALQALQMDSYSLIISEKNPDGLYFDSNISFDDPKGEINCYGWNKYDIHKGEGYFVPVDSNPIDVQERRRIYDEVYVQQKLDAFFFRQAIKKLKLDPEPLFILAEGEFHYDPTHIVPALSELLNVRQPVFKASSKSPMPILKMVLEALAQLNTKRQLLEPKGR